MVWWRLILNLIQTDLFPLFFLETYTQTAHIGTLGTWVNLIFESIDLIWITGACCRHGTAFYRLWIFFFVTEISFGYVICNTFKRLFARSHSPFTKRMRLSLWFHIIHNRTHSNECALKTISFWCLSRVGVFCNSFMCAFMPSFQRNNCHVMILALVILIIIIGKMELSFLFLNFFSLWNKYRTLHMWYVVYDCVSQIYIMIFCRCADRKTTLWMRINAVFIQSLHMIYLCTIFFLSVDIMISYV